MQKKSGYITVGGRKQSVGYYDGLYFDISQKGPQGSMPKEHKHNSWEFYFYLGENMTFFINDTSYVVKKYDLVFVDKNTYHKTNYKNDDRERVLVDVRDEFFDFLKDKSSVYKYLLNISNFVVLSFDEKVKKEVANRFIALSHMYKTYEKDSFGFKISFTELLLEINELIKTNHVTKGAKLNNKNSIIISQIARYINDNYSEKITLEFLAEKFFIDKYHLCRIFKKETGSTVVDFLNQKRTGEAEVLLRTSKMSVGEIATSVGFQNQQYFGLTFKKYYGVSPKEYRKK